MRFIITDTNGQAWHCDDMDDDVTREDAEASLAQLGKYLGTDGALSVDVAGSPVRLALGHIVAVQLVE